MRSWSGTLPVLVIATALATPGIARAAPGIHYIDLIRHGAYDRDSAASDITANGLNDLGRRQAEIMARRLAGLPMRPASLVSSTLLRARETADVIGRVLRMTPARDSILSECTPASDRGPADQDMAACDSQLVTAWRRYMTPAPDADRHDVLVCHGNVIRWFVSRVVAGDGRRWRAMDIGNGSLTVLAVRSDGTVRLVMFSDVGHLPVKDQTWSGPGAGWRRR